MAAHLLDGATPRGRALQGYPEARAFVFSQPSGGSIAAIFTIRPGTPYVLQLPSSFPSGSCTLLDLMGNALPFPTPRIDLSLQPVYLRSTESAETLLAALDTGSVAPETDSTPPVLFISKAPERVDPDTELDVRWIAIDDHAAPDPGQPDAILYSYRLLGVSDEWSPWTPTTRVVWTRLPQGPYQLEVRARDTTGNTTPTVAHPLSVGVPPGRPAGVRLGSN